MSAPEPPDPLIGRTLDGRYKVDARLGEGGLGVVYRVTHARLGRPFAVKVLQPEYAENDGLRARFEREARALGALVHPNVVAVTDFGIDGKVPYLVMELLEGRPLDDAIADGVPIERAVSIARDLVSAVAFAHGLGLVHRDLKPANVFLQRVPDGVEVVRVLDFGLAKFLDVKSEQILTRAGTAMGTPSYMSPEQAMGGAASPKNDVYSLGILLFELFAGERPFLKKGGELMRQHLLEPLPSLSAKKPGDPIVAALEPIIERAASKSPTQRYADAGELRVALDKALDGSVEIKTVAALGAPLGSAQPKAPQLSALPNASETVREGAPAFATTTGPRSAAVTTGPRPSSNATGPRPSATAGRPTAPDEAPVGRRVPVLALLPLAILLPGAIAAGYTFFGSHDTPATTPTEPAVDDAGVTPSERAEGPGVDPWSEEVPAPLAGVVERVEGGATLSEADRATLRLLGASSPHDPRPWLLYGHAVLRAGARTEAMDRYERAMESSPEARHDPRMLTNLLTMSVHATVGRRARQLVVRFYGAEAIPAVEAAITTAEEEEREDLEGLLSSLREE